MNSFLLAKQQPRQEVIDSIGRFLGRLPLTRDFEVLVHPYRRSRTGQQNRALWGVAYKALSDATGHDAEDLHEYFLGEWGGWETRDLMGRKRLVPKRRSSALNTEEFAEFYAFIQQRSAETVGVFVPDPEPHRRTR
jgi:hypothetical protein